jgi:hypothetical protein
MIAVNECLEDQNREFYFWRVKQVGAQVDKVHWCRRRLYWKVRPFVGFSDYRIYTGPRTFSSILVFISLIVLVSFQNSWY